MQEAPRFKAGRLRSWKQSAIARGQQVLLAADCGATEGGTRSSLPVPMRAYHFGGDVEVRGSKGFPPDLGMEAVVIAERAIQIEKRRRYRLVEQ
nr:hypothetical protein [Sphingomonas psychrotolerans]